MSDPAVELSSVSGGNKSQASGHSSPSSPISNGSRPPSLGKAFVDSVRRSFSLSSHPVADDTHYKEDSFIDVDDNGDRTEEAVTSNSLFTPPSIQHHGRLPLHDIAEEDPDEVTSESITLQVEESNKNAICMTQEQFEKASGLLFTKRGGMRHRTKYQYLKAEERSYVKSLNLMSVWYIMPYGYKGSHGINKRLRGRIVHDKWRPLLQQAPRAEVTIRANGQPLKSLVTCANVVTKKSIEGILHYDVCNNHMVKISSALPYSEWVGNRSPVCNLCYEDINLGLDGYYFHCPAKRCIDTCKECVSEIALDPEVNSLKADLTGRNYQPPEVDYDYRVGDCQYVCKGVLCYNCAVSEQQNLYDSTHEALASDPLSPVSKVSQLLSMKSMARSAFSLNVKGPDTKKSFGSSRSIMSTIVKEGMVKKSMNTRKNRDSLESQMSHMQSSVHGSPGVNNNPVSPADESVGHDSLRGLLSEDRDRGDEHDGAHFEEQSVFEMLPILMQSIEKEPSVFFPYLDAYIVSGLRTSMSVYNIFFLILITAIQIFVPLILMLQVRELFESSYTISMSLYDDSNSDTTTRSAACVDLAEGTLDYYSATHAQYTSTVSCVSGYLSTAGYCSRYECSVDVASICSRESAFDRQVAGFFMISILIIITLQQFYYQANSFIFAANTAVASTHRNLALQHMLSETTRFAFTYNKLTAEIKRARDTHWSTKKAFYIVRYAAEASFLYVVMRAIVMFYHLRNVVLHCLGKSLPRRYNNRINDALRQDKEIEAVRVVEAMYTAAFQMKVLLLPTLDSPYSPDDEIKYVLAHVIHHRLPVPYSLLNLLHKTDPKLAPIHPNSVLLSLLANFLAMGFTLTASLYVTVQSKQVSDIVVNTLALQFLLALDDMIEREGAYSDIQLSAIEASSICVKIQETHEKHEKITTLKRKSRSSIIAKSAMDAMSPDVQADDNADETKRFKVLHRKLNENTTDPHGIYAYTSRALFSFIVTGYWGIYDIFIPTTHQFSTSCLKAVGNLLRTVFYYGLWIGICCWSLMVYVIFGLLIVLPISMPLLMLVAGVVIIVYGVNCI